MALLFIDGFDHYATDDITKKWNVNNGASIGNTSPRRAASKYIELGTPSEFIGKAFGNRATVVIGFAYYANSLTNDALLKFTFEGNVHLTVKSEPTGRIRVYRGSTQIAESVIDTLKVNSWQYIEVKVYIHDSTGTVDVHVNGVSVISASGVDTKEYSVGQVNLIYLYGCASTSTKIDDLYIDGANILGDCRVDTLMPNGAGNYTQWDPSAGANYQCVDDPGDINDDTDYCSTSTLNEIDTYNFENLTALGVTIHGLACNVCARKDDASTRKFKPLARVNGSDYEGTEVTLNDNYNVYQNIWDDNPDDAAAWEEADVNGAEFGAKLTA